MRGKVSLSLLASALVVNAMAADDLAGMFKEGKVSGQLRAFYIDRDYTGAVSTHRNGLSLGGHLKYETGSFEGISAGAAFYTANRVFRGIENDTYDPTLFKAGGKSYSILGEAYLQYKNGNTTFKGGRQKLDTPLAGSDDARSLPSLFEAYVLSNTDIQDTTLIAAHVTKFAPGTFANAYNGGVLGVTSGYTLVAGNTAKYQGEFVDMGEWAIGRESDGVSVAAVTYSGIKGLKLQLWDYYAHDILNAVYAEANYGWSYASGIAPYAAVQYIREDNVGNDYAGKVESDFVGAKLGVKFANFDISGAVSHNSKQDATYAANGGTISPWGGMPAYTQGMVTRHQFMAGTDAWKVAASYDWKDAGINLNTGVYYAEFDMDPLNGYSDAAASDKSTEAGFDIIYNPQSVKNLQLRLRGNFPRDFKEANAGDTSWDEYRVIANYNF
jgi:hypothetical protein